MSLSRQYTITTLIGSIAITALAVVVNTATASTVAVKPKIPGETNQQMQTDASKILGNISIAEIALAYGMNDDAMSHINTARQEISNLGNQTKPYSSAKPLLAGKLTYKTAQGQKDYFIPVENDKFVVDTFDGKHLESKRPDMDVADAAIVHYTLFLDSKTVDNDLAKTQNDMTNRQYDNAIADLHHISKGAFSEVTVQNKPLETVRDNLIVSKDLLNNKDYRGASFALKHASSDLAALEKTNPSISKGKDIKDIEAEINSLQATISKDTPPDVKTAESKIDGWIEDVKEKLSKI